MLMLCRLVAALLVFATLAGAAPASAQSTPCSGPVDPAQARLDDAGVAAALAGGLELRVVRQCAGFSVVVQAAIDGAAADDYGRQAERAYQVLAQETGARLSPRAVLFVFVNQDGMAQAEHVVGGRNTDVRDPRAGYAWANTIWIDNDQHPAAADRAEAVAHEFSHLFTAVVTHGNKVPTWFNEGLATNSEVALPAELHPVAAEAQAAEYRTFVLDALTDEFPRPLFELDEITNNGDWQDHFADFDEMDLQYGQAYQFVRYTIGDRGRSSAWAVLREVGKGQDFESAFQTIYGRSVEEADAQARAAWQAEAEATPDPLQVTVRVAGGSDVQVNVNASAGLLFSHASGTAKAGSSLAFEVPSDGSLVQKAGGLDLTAETVDEEDVEYGAYVSVSIRRGEELVERVAFERTYGRWAPTARRTITHLTDDRSFERLDGALSDPFPSGDVIVGQYRR